jgi:hypothetical protein
MKTDIQYIVHIVFILHTYHSRNCSLCYLIKISFYFIIQRNYVKSEGPGYSISARSSEISSGRTETNHSVFKSRLFRENMENPAQFSDQIDQQSDEHQVHLQYNHTSTALMISTGLFLVLILL